MASEQSRHVSRQSEFWHLSCTRHSYSCFSEQRPTIRRHTRQVGVHSSPCTPSLQLMLVLRTIRVPRRFLKKHFPDLQERLGSKDRMLQILVPFCGKTLDLHWYGNIHIVGACTLWSWSRQADKIIGQLLVRVSSNSRVQLHVTAHLTLHIY